MRPAMKVADTTQAVVGADTTGASKLMAHRREALYRQPPMLDVDSLSTDTFRPRTTYEYLWSFGFSQQ